MQWLFINRVFPPANGATGDLLAELCTKLNKHGHSTTVITGRQPGGINVCELSHLLKVVPVASLPFTRKSTWARALSYLSLYPAFLLRALRLPRHGVIVTLTDPPLQLLLGPVIKLFKGGQLIHWAQDIYPEVAEELGVLKRNGWIARILRYTSTWSLKRHDIVVAVGRCMRQRLIDRGVSSQKIVVVPNWAQASSGSAPGNEQAEQGIPGKFVVMYSGNFGLAHVFEPIVDAVQTLESRSPHLMFVFVGDGPQLPWLKEKLATRTNVRFLPFQPKEKLASSLMSANVHLASMSEQLCGLVVPSKVYGILAAGRPCIFLGPHESEVAQLITQTGCGWQLPASASSGLAELLESLANDPARVATLGAIAKESQRGNTAEKAALAIINTLSTLPNTR